MASNDTPALISRLDQSLDLERPKATDLLENLSNEVQVTLADQQADPNSPLYSAQSFEDLNLSDELRKGLYKMGFQRPSKIQERALPLLLSDPPKNMIGQSQSGTGKTAAFTLAMLSRIDYSDPSVQAICVAPTRELARQIMDVVTKMGEFTPAKTYLAVKETGPRSTEPVVAHLVVGTPGTLIDCIKKWKVFSAEKVSVLVLDEADNMISQAGQLGDQTITLQNAIKGDRSRAKLPPPQYILFSATFPDHVRHFAGRFAPNANEIRLKQEELSVEGIRQFYMNCRDAGHKFEIILQLYQVLTIGQSIIFVKRREEADEIAKRMTEEGHKVASLHGRQEGPDRDRVMDDFREGRCKVLIATNVIARGIDVLQVNIVINYDMPTDAKGRPDTETYLHRIGRTGRFGRKGISINFVHNAQTLRDMELIGKQLGVPIIPVETTDTDVMEETLRKALKN